MITKIVKVPKREAYYFCKRLFFSEVGNASIPFADVLDQMGWVAYPYYKETSEDILLLFANTEDTFEYTCNINISHVDIKIIITDIDVHNNLRNKSTNDYELIDISNLEDYYKIELNLKSFVNNLLDTESKNLDGSEADLEEITDWRDGLPDVHF